MLIRRRALHRWFADKGDKTHRLDYDLGKDSLVFDLGGYDGQWSSDIHGMYGCRIHVFEPVEEFAQKIEQRFLGNPKVIVHQFGLASRSRSVKIGLNQADSSMFKSGVRSVRGRLVRAVDFMQEKGIQLVDLMKINIEGGEYDLLEHLITSGLIVRLKNIQVQFHVFVPQGRRRLRDISAALARSHYLTYRYPYVWENWRNKGGSSG